MRTDLKKHLLAGLVIALMVGTLSFPPLGALAGYLMGVGKDVVWDRWMRRGQYDPRDMNYTLLGALLGCLLSVAPWWLLRSP